MSKSNCQPYIFCTRCGNDELTAESPRRFRCARCGFRHFINPIGAVVAILTDRAGDVLLLRRAHDPGKGRLGLPGGFVEPGETGEQALRREIREEIGIEVSRFEYLTSLPNDYEYQGLVTPVLDLVFTAQVGTFAEARAVSEVEELVIVPPERIDYAQLAFRSNAEALRRFAGGHARGAS